MMVDSGLTIVLQRAPGLDLNVSQDDSCLAASQKCFQDFVHL